MVGIGKAGGWSGLIAGLLLLALVILLIGLVRSGSEAGNELRVACAAAFRKPMEEIAERYENETGIAVALNFGGSGALASRVELSGGDLFFPANEGYLEPLEQQGIVLKSWRIARLRAGLVVASGNPKGILELRQLLDEGVRVSLANRSAAIGKVSWALLEKEGLREMIEGNLVVTKPTVTGVVEDVALGAADVTLAWDAVVIGDSRVEWIAIDELAGHDPLASMAVLRSSYSGQQARDFAEYCADPVRGGVVFRQMGFRLAREQ